MNRKTAPHDPAVHPTDTTTDGQKVRRSTFLGLLISQMVSSSWMRRRHSLSNTCSIMRNFCSGGICPALLSRMRTILFIQTQACTLSLTSRNSMQVPCSTSWQWESLNRWVFIPRLSLRMKSRASTLHAYCHSSIFPPHDRRKVTTMVIDGNQKMKMQCAEAPSKRAGRPRKSEKTVGHYTNGWMLGCDPKSGRILSLQPMHEPENNAVAHETLTHVLWLYPKLDCLVYDRACSFKAFGTASGDLDQVKFYIIDGFHAHGHSRTCPCNPRNSSFARIILMCQLSLFSLLSAPDFSEEISF